MWRGESCANGCLLGWFFFSQEPKKQENKKHRKMSNGYCWTDTVAKTSSCFVFFGFSMGFGAFLGHGHKNLEKIKTWEGENKSQHSFWLPNTVDLALQAAPKHKPNSPGKEFVATSSPDSDTQRVPFGPNMRTKEHTSWCQKKPKNHGPQCYKQPHNWSQTAPERNLVLQAAPIATKNVFRLALTCARKNAPVGAKRNPKITDHSTRSSLTTEAKQPQKGIWCYKQPRKRRTTCSVWPCVYCVYLALRDVFVLKLPCPKRNTPFGATSSPKT